MEKKPEFQFEKPFEPAGGQPQAISSLLDGIRHGEAEQILQQAEGYKQKVIADSEGKASRFLAIQSEFAKAPFVTKQRIFYETMEEVFSDMDKVIIDKAGDSVVPYLPLPELKKKDQQ